MHKFLFPEDKKTKKISIKSMYFCTTIDAITQTCDT